jgi:signal transduction histidine kinase
MTQVSTVGHAERIFRRMGTVIDVSPDDSAADAALRMAENEVGCLVVQEGHRLRGIVSERDIVSRVVSRQQDLTQVTVSDFMTTDVVTVTMSTEIEEVHRIMTVHGIRHLPVLAEGVVVGMISSRDVMACQLYEVTSRLAKASKEAKTAREAKQQLLSNVSHELRTPMNGILGVTELAMNTEMTVEQRDMLGMIRESANSLMSVVENILDFSQLDSGKIVLDHRPFSLTEVVAGAVTPHQRAARTKGLEFSCHISPEIPDTLVGDPSRLRQVLSNLVSNAVKFTESGTVLTAIEPLGQTGNDTTVRFSVTDSGTGIAPEKLTSIFEPFQQADGSYTRSHGGTGLGLSISQELVRMMGGRIDVISQEGEGSTFSFALTLPQAGKSESLAFRNPATWREFRPETAGS